MRNFILTAAIAAATVGASSIAAAENWEFAPRLQLGYLYNDNYRLDFAGDELEVSGGVMDVRLPLRLVDPVRKAEIAPRVRGTYFPNESDQDSIDYFLTGLYEQRTQRSVLGIDAFFSREDVVRSELPSPDVDANLGETTTADAGRVLLRNDRDMIRFDPYWNFDISQRFRSEVGGYYLDATYDENLNGTQEDFTDYGAYAGWAYKFSQRSTLTLRGRASRYETSFDADAYGAEAEWRSDYSQTAQVYVRLGAQHTNLDRRGKSSQTSGIGGIGGRWAWPTTNLFIDFTSHVGPTSAGEVVERYQLRARMTRALQPRLSFTVGARATRDEALDSETYPEREYLSGEVGFDWRLTRAWTVLGRYNYIWQEYSDEPADRSSNEVSVGLVYEPGRE